MKDYLKYLLNVTLIAIGGLAFCGYVWLCAEFIPNKIVAGCVVIGTIVFALTTVLYWVDHRY